jgi:hypothetical protein
MLRSITVAAPLLFITPPIFVRTAAPREIDMGAPLVKDEIQDERLIVERYPHDWLGRKRGDLRPRTWIRSRELSAYVSRRLGSMALAKVTPTRLDRLYSTLQKLPEGAEGPEGAPLSSTTDICM